MPEGDTIFRAARTLHRALAGRTVTRFESALPTLTRVHEDTPVTGRTIESVSARGKHLLMAFSGDLLLRTHMRMNGSWHIYRPGERWLRPRSDMRIVVAVDGFVAVGFNIPDAEWLTPAALRRNRPLQSLGPDLLAEDFDVEEVIGRVVARRDGVVADVLLDQRVMAGIGNVYKSEVLFACGVNPFAAVHALGIEQVRCLVSTARRFLRANVTDGLAAMTTYAGFRRTTRRDDPAERLWVYGRGGKPCRRCGTAIAVQKHGAGVRLTYWCPACQP
ncbi:MAG TPA: DNA-formamidopyrimidine glycosylase family protein [Vicinamibacterales bacterium]|nr:DNA-formamidopyrimidine glycosylase family protein [Vicinamibacterales bacterium]